MLINASYFNGEINIPDTHKEAVLDKLNYFITKYEPRFLKQVLGYELYKDFMAGLVVDPIDSKWTALLYGADYTYSNRTYEWEGLIRLPLGSTATVHPADTLELIVGRGQTYDPIDGSSTALIPPTFIDTDFIIERRGTGPLRSDEYTKSGSVLTLVASQFNQDETFFYRKATTIGITGQTSDYVTSPIANYVYYWWLRDNATKTAGQGEVKPKGENSTQASAVDKMCRAWNEMSEQCNRLYSYLCSSGNYTLSVNYGYEFGPYANRVRRSEVFVPINELSI